MKYYGALYLAASAQAAKHLLYTSDYFASNVYALEFDDEAVTLTLKEEIAVAGPHTFIGFNHDKTVLYGAQQGSSAGPGSYHSYDITSEKSLVHTAGLNMTGNCSQWTYPYIRPSDVEPYRVYAAPYADCGHIMTTTANGTLETVSSLFAYETGVSKIHGMAMSPDSSVLYSADLAGNFVWSHDIDPTTGMVSEVNQIEASREAGGPRSIRAHSNGEFVYMLQEEAHVVSSYIVGADGSMTLDKEFELQPEVSNITRWRGNNVELSASNSYLWASNRGGWGFGEPGYLHAYSLNANGSLNAHVATVATPTEGGLAVYVAPSLFDDQWVAVAEETNGTVTIYKFDAEAGTIEAAAVWQSTSDCCAMSVWYD